jgi:hypothetical protein
MAYISQRYQDAYNQNILLCSKRHDELITVAEVVEDLIKLEFPDSGVDVACSTERLQDAVASYFYDIHRYKDFHGMLDATLESRINFQKIYAFTIKWLLKEKPFYLVLPDNSEGVTDELYLEFASTINENIALTWVKLSYHFQTGESIEFSDEEWDKIIYTLKFRDMQTSLLEL